MPDTKPVQPEDDKTEPEPLVEPLGKSPQPAETGTQPEGEQRPATPSEDRLGDLVRDPELRQELGSLQQLKGIIERFIDTRSVIFLGETHIHRDFVARDQYRGVTAAGTVETPFAAEHVLAEDLARVRAVYVRPPAYDHAQRVVTNQHLLILRGRPHIGKWTTALHLGAEILRAERIIQIDPDLRLGDFLKADALEERACYVTETLTPDSARGLTEFLIKQLRRTLQAQRSHLILCTDANAPLAREPLEGYLVEWSEVPPADQVLDSHLRFYLADPDELKTAQDLVRSDEVQAALSQHLLPRELDRLAGLLAQVARNEITLDRALAQFEARVESQVRNWFDTHEDPDQLALMVTLAAFSGARYHEVMAAHKQLLELVNPQEITESEAPPPSVFASRRRRRLEECHAHLEPASEEREFGRSQTEVVVFDNPTFQPAVLAYIWDEFDELRPPLLSWLASFGTAPFSLRARAAAAAGELGKHDFVTILDTVVRPWANSPMSRARDAAALALGILAWFPDRTAEVRGLLNHWVSLRDNWRLRWTAAAAHGSLAGLRFPETALRNLFTIIADGDPRLLGVVSRSIAFLFEAGDAAPEFSHKVLKTLAVWTEDKTRLTRLVSLLIFLDLAGLQEPGDTAADQAEAWPRLLRLSHDEDELRGVTTTLLRRALSEKVTRRPALDTVHEWLKQADGDTDLETAIIGILRGIATEGDARERQRLHYFLNGWANDRVSPLPAAAQVLRELGNDLTR